MAHSVYVLTELANLSAHHTLILFSMQEINQQTLYYYWSTAFINEEQNLPEEAELNNFSTFSKQANDVLLRSTCTSQNITTALN